MQSCKSCHVTFVVATILLICTPSLRAGSIDPNDIVVNTVEDIVDFGGGHLLADLPGPDALISFREAVMAANNTSGPQRIVFQIPVDDWWLLDDVALLKIENGAFFVTDDETTIDFTTQTEFTGDTNPAGGEVGFYGLEPNAWGVAAVWVNANHCVVKGLGLVYQRGYGVRLGGNYNRVISSTVSGPLYAGVYITGGAPNEPAIGNIVGGTEPGEGNSLSAGNAGVRIDGPAEDNVVIGNHLLTGVFSGVEVRSASCCPGYEAVNNRIGGPTLAERNLIAGAGKYGEEGLPIGAQVSVEYATGTIVEGNYIGTTADGNSPYPVQRGPSGVDLTNSKGTIVRNNLISGIAINGTNHYAGQRFGVGVSIEGDCSNSDIEGNRIGTNADGTQPVTTRSGIAASFWPATPSPSNLRIGGTQAGQGNLIAFTETVGVLVQAVVNNIRVSGNSIHDNGGLGIDLMAFGAVPGALGPSPNDAADADNGGNKLQNFPSITDATTANGTVTIAGTLNSRPNQMYAIEFFSNNECDASGFGEGQHFLGTIEVQTDAAGEAAFVTSMVVSVVADGVITSTATDEIGNTSEFSMCAATSSGAVPGDADGDGDVDLTDYAAHSPCLMGPAMATPGSCHIDFDFDGDVDMHDMVLLQMVFGTE